MSTLVLKNLLDSPYSRNNLNPWWEKMHSSILSVHLFFFVTFGIISKLKAPSCFPVNGTDLVLTESQLEFITNHCEGSTYLQIHVVIAYVLLLEVGARLSGFLYLDGAFDAFAVAEKMWNLSPHLKSTKQGESFQTLLNDPYSRELREVAHFLWSYNPGRGLPVIILRDLVLLFGNVANLLLAIVIVRNSPKSAFFSCKPRIGFHWFTNITTPFDCINPVAEEYLGFALLYYATIWIQLILRVYSLFWTCSVLKKSRICACFRIRSAGLFLWISNLAVAFRPECERKFAQFAMSILTDGSVKEIQGLIDIVGEKADSPKIVWPTLRRLDQKTVELGKRHRSIARKEEEVALVELPGSSSAESTSPARPGINPDAEALLNRKLWRWVVFLLNKKFREVDTPRLLGETEPDDEGNSLLFYALNRESTRKFSLRAAEKILHHTNVVWCQGVEFSAMEFVNEQYLNDPAYPEALRDQLVMTIKENEKEVLRSHGEEAGSSKQQEKAVIESAVEKTDVSKFQTSEA